MFYNHNKNIVKISNSKNYKNIEIKSNEDKRNTEMQIIFDCLRKISVNNNVFLDYIGDESLLVESIGIKKRFVCENNPYRSKVWLLSSLGVESIIEEFMLVVYIFTKDFSWEKFVSSKCTEKTNYKNPNLMAVCFFGDCEYPQLKISKKLINEIDHLVLDFKKQGYLIKNW